MAAVTISAGNQLPLNADTKLGHKAANAAIGHGIVIYEDTATGKVGIADHTAEATAVAIGITYTKSLADGHEIHYVREGEMYLGSAVLTQGVTYYLGTAGAIVPDSDVGTGDFVTILGIAKDGNTLDVDIKVGTAKP